MKTWFFPLCLNMICAQTTTTTAVLMMMMMMSATYRGTQWFFTTRVSWSDNLFFFLSLFLPFSLAFPIRFLLSNNFGSDEIHRFFSTFSFQKKKYFQWFRQFVYFLSYHFVLLYLYIYFIYFEYCIRVSMFLYASRKTSCIILEMCMMRGGILGNVACDE